MMLPRRSSFSRLLLLVSCFMLGIWLWESSSSPPRSRIQEDIHISPASMISQVKDVLDQSHESLLSGSDATKKSGSEFRFRDGADSKEKNSAKSEMRSGNQTLENLKHNMTMLKANMSGIGQIMEQINNTVDHHLLDVPNPHPFRYLINTETMCRNKDIFALAYVHTAPDHYKRRMVIRETWGNGKYYVEDGINLRVIFVMGRADPAKDASVQAALEFEAEQYHDIVQEDFLDTYHNLTYKGIAGLKWISQYCPHARFILKTDDDIFVNTFTLFRHLKSLEQGVENNMTIMCLVWSRMKVMREGKWKVDRSEFKDDYYPTYCSGSAFTMTTDTALALHNISYYVPFFWVDDFYITGLLPMKIGAGKVKHKPLTSTYVLNGKMLNEKFTGPQWFTYIFSHVHDLNAVQSVWTRLVALAKGERRTEVRYALPGQLPDEQAIFRKRDEDAKKKKEEDEKKKKKEEEAKKKKEEEAKKKKAKL